MDEEGPTTKRQRLEALKAEPEADAAAVGDQQQSPAVTCLFQVSAGLPKEPSPGAMHGCRVVAWQGQDGGSMHSTYGSVLASGRSVYWSQLLLPHQQLQAEQQGKEGVLLPLRLHAPAVSELQLPRHAGEVQGLALCSIAGQQDEMLLATVDAFGAGSLSRLRPVEHYSHVASAPAAEAATDADDDPAAATAAAAAAGPVSGPEVVVQSHITPTDACREGGWAGVAFSASADTTAAAEGPLLLATARCFAKDLCLYDVDSGKALRSFGCVQNPYALSFLPAGAVSSSGSSVLAAAEGHAVVLRDVRTGGAGGGVVQRYSPGALGQPLYCLSWCRAQAGLLGAAGAERSLFLTEPRKWRGVSKWHSATRLAIHHLAFLDSDPHCALLAGLDLEVICGRWDSPGSNTRPFESARQPDEHPAAAAAAGGDGGGGGGDMHRPAAPGAPGSGDRSRRGAQACSAAGAGGGGGGMDVEEGEGGAAAASVFSFRGDGRWLGVSKAAGVDVITGFAASGNVVYARVA